MKSNNICSICNNRYDNAFDHILSKHKAILIGFGFLGISLVFGLLMAL